MSQDGPIRLHPENPRYFLYRGQPRVLITATEHYGAVLNRNFDYHAYLDDAADKKMTLSRCFLLFRELEGGRNPHSPCKPVPAEYLAPFARTGPGYAMDGYPKFDLSRWDTEFMERLHGFLSAAAERDIVVELTLFSNTYWDGVWELNPFNIHNNVNGVGDIAWQDYNSMLDAGMFEYQKTYVRKIVQEVNSYDNCYLEICNEPFGDHPGHVSVADVEAWHTALRNVIREEEARLPKQHLIFQVPTERSRGGAHLDGLVDEPSIDAIDLHDYHLLFYKGLALHPLSRFMEGDLKLEGVHYLWTACHSAGKPLVFDEDNAATFFRNDMGWTIQRKRAWTVVCSGGHYDMIDFSIQSGGQEQGTPESREKLRSWMRHLSAFIHTVDFVHTVPVRGFCVRLPEHTLAATLVNPGQEYVIYVADVREADERGSGEPCEGPLAFTLPRQKYEVKLYDPVSGGYSAQTWQLDGGDVTLQLPPFVHDVVVHITAVN